MSGDECRECPYGHECRDTDLPYGMPRLAAEALSLLREHEAVEARKKSDGKPQPWTSWWYVCGDCGQEIEYHDRFCRWCGRAVMWNG